MMRPAWLSPIGVLEHFVIGAVLTVLFGIWCPSGVVFTAVLIIALVHEQAQTNWSDFRTVNGGPWNGALDVVSFLIVPAFYLLFA